MTRMTWMRFTFVVSPMAHAVPTLALVAAAHHAHGAVQRPAVPVLSAPLNFRPRRRLRAVRSPPLRNAQLASHRSWTRSGHT